MLKQTLKKIIGRDFAFKIKLFYSQKSGSYFTNKPLGQKEDYIKLYNNFLEKIKKKSFVNDHFTDEDIEFINKLALKTQVVKKDSEINWTHGFVILKTLREYLQKNKLAKVVILETGTAAGFSSVIMSYALKLQKKNYQIFTIDILPHEKKIYWNRISDHLVGKTSRKELLNEYSEFLHNIEFINDVSKNFFKNKPSFDRINFAFIDGSHEYEDAKIEFDFIDKHNFKNDVIILDDYSPGKYDGIVKITNYIKSLKKYDVNIVSSDDLRGYVILKKL